MKSKDFDQAREWAHDLYGEPNFLHFWFPRSHFLEAERGEDWMSATRDDGGAIYGMAIGAHAQNNPVWTHFSISRFANQDQIDSEVYVRDGEWDAFVIETQGFSHLPEMENLSSHLDEVSQFLEENFPDASTKADSDEVLSWCALRDKNQKLVGIGALSEWESGGLAAQSIAVACDERGKGYGRALVEGMIATSYHLGHESLCLGVWFHNLAAKALYESLGFIRVDSFLHYSQSEDVVRRRNRPSRN